MLFVFFITLIAVIFILSHFIQSQLYEKTLFVTSWERQLQLTAAIKKLRPPSPRHPVAAKGVYVTAYTAGGDRINDIIRLIMETELNAVVIDIKDYSGWISYDTDVELINVLGTEKVRIHDLPGLLTRLRELDIYSIARMQVFQDPVLTRKRPELAIKNKLSNDVWTDWKGLAWLDPHSEEVWEYHVALARDAIQKGFDEINFDYVRFPSDGPISQTLYPFSTGESKEVVINNFFNYLDRELDKEPAYLSVDLFGMTLWSDDDFNIGQTLRGAVGHFDYISPMIYPSHYASGFDGFANPALYPYEVIFRNLKKATPLLSGSKTLFRPWLQDFNLGAVYTKEMVRAEIEASEENNTFGWLLWNASNNYTKTALHSSGQ